MTAHPESLQTSTPLRLHSLDGLRATMMLLGLVLHCACNYQDDPPNPAWDFRDDANSASFRILVGFIHAWRMPIFMFLAGFFGALLVERRSVGSFFANRLSRLGGPLLLFLPLLLPLVVAGFRYAKFVQLVGAEDAWGYLAEVSWAELFPRQTMHLWFIYYLLIYSIAAALFVPLGRALPAPLRPSRMVGRLVGLPGASLLLSMPIGLALMGSNFNGVVVPGVLIPGIELVPEPTSFLTYGWLYLCGWSLWSRRELLEKNATWPRIVACLGGTVALFMYWMGLVADPTTIVGASQRFFTAFVSGWVMWLSIWGFLGLFAKCMPREVPWVRYLVDASYWLYVLHLPFTIWIPGYLAEEQWSSYAKFGVTVAATTLVGLVTYELFVRSTWIGRLLNGRRAPRALVRALRNRPLA